ncbi:MAG: hypothetical protein EAZ09_25435 [Oscillatoriales cyanobacterium]|nr:MAG: hypothetical protein EAZ18_21670 [Oscillatoriales cyanobacterium]TAH15008.1 MAG: hypothetical protein EAZ09_25435 [Oscillatoriales cyanobacterium]
MLIAILIIFIGLTPWLLSLWVMRSSTIQTRERIAVARLAVANRPLPTQLGTGDRTYIEALAYPIGDLTCEYLRCAVNPEGPCKGCPYYKAQTIRHLPKGQS